MKAIVMCIFGVLSSYCFSGENVLSPQEKTNNNFSKIILDKEKDLIASKMEALGSLYRGNYKTIKNKNARDYFQRNAPKYGSVKVAKIVKGEFTAYVEEIKIQTSVNEYLYNKSFVINGKKYTPQKTSSVEQEHKNVYSWLLKNFPKKKKTTSLVDFFIPSTYAFFSSEIGPQLAQTVAFHVTAFSHHLDQDVDDPSTYFSELSQSLEFQSGYECSDSLNKKFIADVSQILSAERYNANDSDLKDSRRLAIKLDDYITDKFEDAVDEMPEDSRRYIVKDFINDQYSHNYCMNSMAKLYFAKHINTKGKENPYHGIVCVNKGVGAFFAGALGIDSCQYGNIASTTKDGVKKYTEIMRSSLKAWKETFENDPETKKACDNYNTMLSCVQNEFENSPAVTDSSPYTQFGDDNDYVQEHVENYYRANQE